MDSAIIQAVLDLLAGGTTFDSLSMDAVAATAGVGKATIYRRWPNKEALVLDAVASLKGPVPQVTGRSVREDLVILLRGMSRPRTTRQVRVFNCLVPELQRNPGLRASYQELIERRRDVTRQVLRRGVATGEVRPDVDIDLVMAMLQAPILTRDTVNWHADLTTDELPERLVEIIMAGIAAPATGPPPADLPPSGESGDPH